MKSNYFLCVRVFYSASAAIFNLFVADKLWCSAFVFHSLSPGSLWCELWRLSWFFNCQRLQPLSRTLIACSWPIVWCMMWSWQKQKLMHCVCDERTRTAAFNQVERGIETMFNEFSHWQMKYQSNEMRSKLFFTRNCNRQDANLYVRSSIALNQVDQLTLAHISMVSQFTYSPELLRQLPRGL